ncbi:MAG: HAMP domain-containing histidine kinase [Verrucomicrobiae bacterium]|nr:HAMP domain-containing histidine kinase [Verrucomicrobiae bacterium]
MSDSPKLPAKPTVASGGGVFRGLAIPFLAFLLVASLALMAWIDWSLKRASLRQFEQTAAANARIVDQMRLPRSPELARNLGTVLGVGVGFRFASKPGLGEAPELEEGIERLVGEKPASGRAADHDIALAPLAGGDAHLVLVRVAEPFLPGRFNWLLAPLIVTALGGGIAFLIARRIVRPLQLLEQWLPNLDQTEPARISPSVTNRADEIGTLARSLEATHRRVLEEQDLRRQSERMATLGRIATSLAHEIKNPAAAIRLHVDLLARNADRDDADSIESIQDEIDRITDLINQWLFVARAAPPRTDRHDLAAMSKRVLHRLAPQMNHAGVTATLKGLASAEVDVDASRIEQVMRNLFLNATQAMPTGGAIEADLTEESDAFVLMISDEGPGFSEQAQQHWQEPFFSEREGGMGLGLTLAVEVMQAHGGTLSIENRESGGAAVCCRFPKARRSLIAP